MIFSEVKSNILKNIQEKIEKGGIVSPFLFLGENLEILHNDIENFIQTLFQENHIDSQSLFHLIDTGELIKIKEIKGFLSRGDIKPRFQFQIFFIENISRMTPQSANACLKFFEEPGEGNIIFLTNASESGILETILSRVQTQHLFQLSPSKKNETAGSFYISMIESHVSGSSDEIVRYFFSGKYDKQEYVDFLKSIVGYIGKTGNFLHLLDELHEDIGGILKNNLQGKYIVDKYIMLLGV